MSKLENYHQLLNVLGYGRDKAVNAGILAAYFEISNMSEFKRKVRLFAHEARANGHWVIGDNSGYFLAVNRKEWNKYKKQRLLAINNELRAIANCDNITFGDLIKNVYAITPTDKNYEMF